MKCMTATYGSRFEKVLSPHWHGAHFSSFFELTDAANSGVMDAVHKLLVIVAVVVAQLRVGFNVGGGECAET